MYIEIDQDTGFCSEEGEWHGFQLVTHGAGPQELLDNACIAEIDQDGGERSVLPIAEYPYEVYRRCCVMIAKAWLDAEVKEIA